MGGPGSGRLNKTDSFIKHNVAQRTDAPFDSVSGAVASIGEEVLVLPNHSGIAVHPEFNKAVDDKISEIDLSAYVLKAGDTMTGDLILSGAALTVQGLSSLDGGAEIGSGQELVVEDAGDIIASVDILMNTSNGIYFNANTTRMYQDGTNFIVRTDNSGSGDRQFHIERSTSPVLALRSRDSSINEGDNIGTIQFRGNEGAEVGARIWAEGGDSWSSSSARQPGNLYIGVNDDSSSDESLTPKMTFHWEDGIMVGDTMKFNNDNRKLFFGAGNDASIYYDGTDMILDPQEVGSGLVVINDSGLVAGNGQVAGDEGSSLPFHLDITGTGHSIPSNFNSNAVAGYFTRLDNNMGIALGSDATHSAIVYFGDIDDFDAGRMQYINSTDSFRFVVDDKAGATGPGNGRILLEMGLSSGGVQQQNITIGAAQEGDVHLQFRAGTNTGELRWMEDEDYFEFQDEVRFIDDVVLVSRTDANRGSAGVAGRIIFNTDDGQLNIDDGTNWTLPDGTTT